MFARIDSFLLSLAQKFCDRFQRFTGLTVFWLMRWTIAVTLIFYLLYATILDASFAPWVLIVATLHSIRGWKKEETEFFAKRVPEHHFYPSFFRIIMILNTGAVAWFSLAGSLLPELFMLGGMATLLANMYFMSCVPLPPCKSTVHEWHEKGLRWLSGRLSKPVPIPIR